MIPRLAAKLLAKIPDRAAYPALRNNEDPARKESKERGGTIDVRYTSEGARRD
jgi:hypothetical protein